MSCRLVCGGTMCRVGRKKLLGLRLFEDRPELLEAPSYEVTSPVSEAVFETFIDAIQGEEVEVTDANFLGLTLLCDEFGFGGLHGALGAFRASPGGDGGVLSVLRRVSAQEREIEALKCEVQSLKRGSEGGGLRTALETLLSRVGALEQRQVDQMDAIARVEARVADLGARLERVHSSVSDESKVMKNELASLAADAKSLKAAPIGGTSSPSARPTDVPQRPGREFAYKGNASGGIIAALTRECGGNVDAKGVVAVTARDKEAERKVVALEDIRSYYCSNDEPGAWLCLDFKDRRVKPTHYSIRTYGNGKGHQHLKSWVIEGSLDGSGWSELDRRENNEDLNGPCKEKTFPVSKSGEFRFIRLRSIGKNHYGSDFLFCSAFELFGTLLE